MDRLLADLIPLLFGALLAPIYPIVVLLLLQSNQGLSKASVFVTSAIGARMVQGLVFGLVFGPAVESEAEAGFQLLGPILMMVAGIVLLVLGVKKWLAVSSAEDDEVGPEWMSKLHTMKTPRAVLWGAALVLLSIKQWVFTLTAIGIIQEAQLTSAMGIGLYLLYTVGTQALVVPPIIAFAIAPERTSTPLNSARLWLEKHNRTIVILVSLIFGLYFTYKGVVGVLANGA